MILLVYICASYGCERCFNASPAIDAPGMVEVVPHDSEDHHHTKVMSGKDISIKTMLSTRTSTLLWKKFLWRTKRLSSMCYVQYISSRLSDQLMEKDSRKHE